MSKKSNILCVALSLLFAFSGVLGAGCTKEENDVIQPPTQETETLEKSGYKLVKSGVSEYKILLPAQARASELQAANELCMLMKKATGVTLPIVYEEENGKDFPVISIGQTQLATENGVSAEGKNLNRSGYVIKTVGNKLFIVGGENFTGMGCVYGVYDFLEDCIGYRYYYADEIYYEQKSNVDLYKYDDVVIPSIDFRATSYPSLGNDKEYRTRLRYSLYNEEYGWYAHTQTETVLNKDLYMDRYYGSVDEDGNPNHWFSNTGAQQICWTAGEEMELQAAKDIYVNITNNPDKVYFQVGQADNANFCSCERCEAAKAEWAMNDAGLQINFANHVVEIVDEWVKRDYPQGRDVRITIFAYMGTDDAPVEKGADGKWKAFSDQVIPHPKLYFQYAPIYTNYSYDLTHVNNAETYENLQKWNDLLGERGRMSLWTYETNFHYFLYNFNNFATFKSHLQTFTENGIDNIYSQGATRTNQPCFQELRLFVQSQLMWDLNKDYNTLVDEFIGAFYKDAAAEIKEYYDLVKFRYEQAKVLQGIKFDGIYSDIASKSIWTEGVVNTISDIFQRAYAKIEKYKTSDPATYTKLYERIIELELTNIYTILTYYRDNYKQADLNKMIDDFNYYTSKFGIIHYREGTAALVYATNGMFDMYKK